VAGLNWLIGSQLSLLITGSPTAKNNKQICTDSLPLKKTTSIHNRADSLITISVKLERDFTK
jgi:hypothetical protein